MSRSRNLSRRLRDLKDEHIEMMERRAAYVHDVNRAVSALESYGKEKKRIEPRHIKKEQEHEQNEANDVEDTGQHSDSTDPEKIVDEAEESATQNRPEAPQWAKKAYRQIVQITHPDKVDRDPNISDARRDRLCSLYVEAGDAFRQGKWSELLEVAAELDIDVEADDPKMMETALESKIKELTDTIAKVKGTIAWVWGTSFGDTQKKVGILIRCCEVMNVEQPPTTALEEIVRELESNTEFDIVDRLGHVKRLKIDAVKRKIGTRPEKRFK